MATIANKYEVLSEIGAGGTGMVYLVRHIDLGVHYALKLLCQDFSEDERFIEKFKQEAEVLLRFAHPGTTPLRDFGRTPNGMYYIAMDYCDGLPLKDVLERDGPYHIRGAVQVIIQVLEVLEAAHREGIVHRDIKPGNILIQTDDSGQESVRVLDFGTALLKERIEEAAGGADVASIGTPCYMSPEQAAGETHLDHRTDIYSAGVVLYELLTGDVPFEGSSVVQTLLMHLTQPPQPFAAKYGIPPFIEGIVFRALEKEPERRFQSCSEFREECEAALEKLSASRGGVEPKKLDTGQGEKQAQGDVHGQQGGAGKEEVKILCLDDNEMILNILKHILEKEGYTVFTALDCSSIHNYLFNEGIDLLVSDIQMPGMPGTKVCRLLKKSMEELKVILFSNIPERDLERCSEENNADAWISKQTKPEEWLQVINRVIAEQSA